MICRRFNYSRLEGNRIFEEGNTDKAIELYTKAIAKAGANNPCHKLFNNRFVNDNSKVG